MPEPFARTLGQQSDTLLDCGAVFLREMAYGALISPANSVRQMCGLAPLQIFKPQESSSRALTVAKSAGDMAANVFDFVVLRKFIGAAAGERICALESGCNAAAALPQFTRASIGLSTLTGLAQGYALTEVHYGDKSFISMDRLKQGLVNAAAMPASDGTMALTELGPTLTHSPHRFWLELGKTAVAGAASGFGQKEASTRLIDGHWASSQDLTSAIVGGAIGGAAFHSLGRVTFKVDQILLSSRAQWRDGLAKPLATRVILEAQGEAGPFASKQDFDNRAGSTKEVDVNVYRTRGAASRQIVISREFDQTLNQLRQLRDKTKSNYMQVTSKAWSTLAGHPYKYQLLPEEVPQHLSTLPNPTYFKQVILQNERSPADIFLSQQAGRDVFSAAKTIPGQDSLTVFPGRNGVDYDALFKHEWSHQLEAQAPHIRDSFDLAAQLEKDGYFERDYARLNTSENWAVHMESMLGEDSQKFEDFVNQAPLRAAILSKALRGALDSCPPGERSPLHNLYTGRSDYIDKRTVKMVEDGLLRHPTAVATLMAASDQRTAGSIFDLATAAAHDSANDRQALALETLRLVPSQRHEALKFLKNDEPEIINSPHWPALRTAAENYSDTGHGSDIAQNEDALRAFYNSCIESSHGKISLAPWKGEWESLLFDLTNGSFSDNFPEAFH